MLKWIGVGLILCAFALICRSYLHGLFVKKKENERAFSLLSLLLQEILQYETPLPTLLQKAQKEVDYPPSFWEIGRQKGLYFSYLSYVEEVPQAKELFLLMKDCLCVLGKSEKSLQLQVITQAKEKVQAKMEEEKKELPKKIRLYVTVCLCVGASLVILLV
jgi:hypothetical protein